MKTVRLFGVEHCRIDGSLTYEIFKTLKDAENFVNNENNWDNNNIPLYIFSSNFNNDCIYEEDNGQLNYEDYYDTLQGNFEIIKHISSFQHT